MLFEEEKKNALSLHDCSIKKAELEQEPAEKELVQEGGGWGICTNWSGRGREQQTEEQEAM